MVYYLKYRPQTIDDLDSSAVRATLKSVLSGKDLPHAFLFTGPKGLGKTSSARIVAKIINCTAVKSKRTDGFEPCSECESCRSITSGSNLDILEIDAASNRGIDEIRELKEKIRLAPVSSKKKVYIIDEVHMLTTEAFNALLKTLEEPPEHAVFILATTEAHKVPATILSRCFHVGFKKATGTELVRSFERIAKSEKLDVDKKTLEYIADLSDGSFRDGAKILEEVAVLAGSKKLSAELVEEKYKSTSVGKSVSDFIASLRDKDTKKSLGIINDISDQGVDMKYFTQSVIDVLHGELLSSILEDTVGKNGYEIGEIKIMLDLLSKAYAETRHAVIAQLPLELFVIEYTAQENIEQSKSFQSQSVSGPASIGELRKREGNLKKITAMYGSVKQNSVDNNAHADTKSGISLLHVSNGEITPEWLESFWRSLIAEIKGYNHTIAGVLRGCRIEKFDKEGMTIETIYKFHKERLDDAKTLAEISRVAKLLTGREMKVEVQLKGK